MSLTVGSLFSGIGGLDLGLERAGMEIRWQSEIDPYASQVLAKHWPNTPNLGDITVIDWTKVEPVDLICGGYPCQPFSVAGQRQGTDDPRHLWPHMRNALRVLRPRYALLENVAGHLSLGFDRVLADLAAIGFDAEWSIVSACSMGAPHVRARLFILAYPTGERRGRGRIMRAEGSQGELARPLAATHWGLETRPPIERMADGFSARVDRLRTLGNAVVPQVAQWIGEQLLADLSLLPNGR